jgi:hypothetical protein
MIETWPWPPNSSTFGKNIEISPDSVRRLIEANNLFCITVKGKLFVRLVVALLFLIGVTAPSGQGPPHLRSF